MYDISQPDIYIQVESTAVSPSFTLLNSFIIVASAITFISYNNTVLTNVIYEIL